MNRTKKKKAFTLTELLVVIVIAGVLAAVALPKFNAVVETRRTGEAEELASAIRNEQERRCALDQSYSVHPNQIGVAGVNTANATFNKGSFEYTLNETGLIAKRTDKDYSLVMPSYKDGRMYCEGEYCAKLNKNYARSQAELSGFRAADECAAPIGEDGGQTACEIDPSSCECNPNQAKCCTGNTVWNGTACVEDTPCNRDPYSCECNPKQEKCVVPQEPEPLECDESSKPEESHVCGNCGMQNRSIECDTTTGQWKIGNWGACTNQGECTPSAPAQYACENGAGGYVYKHCTSACRWTVLQDNCCTVQRTLESEDIISHPGAEGTHSNVCGGGNGYADGSYVPKKGETCYEYYISKSDKTSVKTVWAGSWTQSGPTTECRDYYNMPKSTCRSAAPKSVSHVGFLNLPDATQSCQAEWGTEIGTRSCVFYGGLEGVKDTGQCPGAESLQKATYYTLKLSCSAAQEETTGGYELKKFKVTCE